MNIQLSVSIWTVICFILLMVILHNLLFKPVLRTMDQRRERLEKAKEKQSLAEKMTIEYENLCNEKREALEKQRKMLVRQEIEQIRLDSKRAVESAGAERIREVEEFRIKSHNDHEQIVAVLSEHSNEIARIFAESMIKEQ